MKAHTEKPQIGPLSVIQPQNFLSMVQAYTLRENLFYYLQLFSTK